MKASEAIARFQDLIGVYGDCDIVTGAEQVEITINHEEFILESEHKPTARIDVVAFGPGARAFHIVALQEQ